jgi:hypothetical protein
MKDKRFWKILGITLVALALLCVTAVVLAGPPAQGPGSEDSEAGFANSPPKSAEVIGDDPDEDGYVGSIAPNNDSGASPSEPDTGSASNWDQFFLEPQPDEDGYTGPVPLSVESSAPPSEPDADNASHWDQFFLEPQPDEDGYSISAADIDAAWSDFYYVFAAGSTMRPRDSATTWGYPGSGCVSAAVGNDLFTLHLDLPEGSRIDYLRIFYYDTSANDSRTWITAYDGAGGYDDIATVLSSGNGGYGTEVSAYVGEVVSNLNNAYVLNWRASQTGDTMRLCGLRVAYRLPD